MLLRSNLTFKSVQLNSRLFFYDTHYYLTRRDIKTHRYNNFNDDETKNNSEVLKFPEEPQNCCMSGCANCVWVSYAENLADLLNDGGEAAKKKILENVKDPNLRTFVLLEISHLKKKKDDE